MTTLPQGAAALINVIHVSDVLSSKELNRATDGIAALRCQQQMHGVRHQHVCVDQAAMSISPFVQPRQVGKVLLVGKEDCLFVVTALRHMHRDIGHENARLSG